MKRNSKQETHFWPTHNRTCIRHLSDSASGEEQGLCPLFTTSFQSAQDWTHVFFWWPATLLHLDIQLSCSRITPETQRDYCFPSYKRSSDYPDDLLGYFSDFRRVLLKSRPVSSASQEWNTTWLVWNWVGTQWSFMAGAECSILGGIWHFSI